MFLTDMPAPIQDEFTKLPISRELKRQMRCMKAGVCQDCGCKTAQRRCEKCMEKDSKRHRKRYKEVA